MTDNPSIRTSEFSDHPMTQDQTVISNSLDCVNTLFTTMIGEKNLLAEYLIFIKDKVDAVTYARIEVAKKIFSKKFATSSE